MNGAPAIVLYLAPLLALIGCGRPPSPPEPVEPLEPVLAISVEREPDRFDRRVLPVDDELPPREEPAAFFPEARSSDG